MPLPWSATARLEGIKVANKPKQKMPVSERAKQFMPFSALKGLYEALLEKEKVIVPKPELSEEKAEEIDQKLHQIQIGKIITAVYYDGGEYLKITGMVANFNSERRLLQIVDTEIAFDDLIDIL